MSNAEIISGAIKLENNSDKNAEDEKIIKNQSTISVINECFDILHETLLEIKSIVKNNKEVLSTPTKPRQTGAIAPPRVRVFVKSIRRNVRTKPHRTPNQKMSNEQNAERKSEENNDNDESLIDKNLKKCFQPRIDEGERKSDDEDSKNGSINGDDIFQKSRDNLQPISTNYDLEEIRGIVETIEKAVFYIIDNNFVRLANRSSNTLGMRVKDSLILKAKQSNKKAIPFDALKTSALVCRLIVDDDIQIRFLPRVESLVPKSGSENSSTKQKKSVSLADEVKIFDPVENEAFDQNEVNVSNELVDPQSDRIMEHEESDEKTYDFTSQKGSDITLQSQASTNPQCDANGTTENVVNFDKKEEIQNILLNNLHNLSETSPIFKTSLNQNQLIVNLAETKSRSGTAIVQKSWVAKRKKGSKNTEDKSHEDDDQRTNFGGKDNEKSNSEDENVSAVDRSAIGETENEEILNRRSSLFSRIVRSKNRKEKNTGPEKKHDLAVEICRDSESMNDKIDAESSENQTNNHVEIKNNGISSNIKSTEFKQLANSQFNVGNVKMKSAYDGKSNDSRNDHSVNKSSSEVSPNGNELSKQSSITENSVNRASPNDNSLKQTPSKVSRKASQSSRKLSRTDIGRSNSYTEGETLTVFYKDENLLKDIDPRLHVSVSDERLQEWNKKLQREKRSKSSMKRILAQVFPVTEITTLQRKNLNDEIMDTNETDKVEIKTNRSRSSLKDEKSSATLQSAGNDAEKETFENNYDDEKLRMSRKKSVLNVVSKSSTDKEEEGNLEQENEPDNEGNNDDVGSESWYQKSSKGEDKSEVVVDTNGDQDPQLDDPLEPSVNVKKRGRFMEGLKRSLQTKRNRPKRSEGKNDPKLKVSSASQTDIEEDDLTSESLIEFNSRNDAKEFLQSNATEVSKSSSKNDEDNNYRENETGSLKLSREGQDKDDEITHGPGIGNEIQESLSKNSNRLAEATAQETVEVYSIAVDSVSNKNNHSVQSDLSIDEPDASSVSNEPELVVKFSEDLESSAVERKKDKPALQVNKSGTKLWRKKSSKSSSKVIIRSGECSNDDGLRESKDSLEGLKSEERITKRSKKSVQKRKMKTKSKERDQMEVQRKIKTSKSKIETDQVFPEKSKTLIVSYLDNPSIQEQTARRIVNADELRSDCAVIGNQSSNEQSQDSIKQEKERHSLLSNIKSIFKSLNKSESRKYSIPSIEDAEKINETQKSVNSWKINKLGTSKSEIEVDEEVENSLVVQKQNVQVSMIVSTKSLEDNRKRSKNRRKTGHKLLDDENVHVKDNNDSKLSIAESNSEISATDNEEGEEKTDATPGGRKKSKQHQQDDVGNAKKFAASLSRIFSNSSRKKNTAKGSRATLDSPINPDEHFQITKIPLSSSDDSSIRENHSEIMNKKSNTTEDNKEEIVAIKSLDSMHDLDCFTADKGSVVNSSSRFLEHDHNGTLVLSVSIEANELARKQSKKNTQDLETPPERIHPNKGAIVSYAPMVESAKYISQEHVEGLNDDEEPAGREKESSSGKSFATIRKLFSKSSVQKDKKDRAESDEDRSVDEMDDGVKLDSSVPQKSITMTTSRRNKKRSKDHLSSETDEASIMSVKVSEVKKVKDEVEKREEKRKSNSSEIEKQSSSKFKFKNRKQKDAITNRSELADEDERTITRMVDLENGSKSVNSMEFKGVDIVVNKVELNQRVLGPTEVAKQVVDEFAIPSESRTDLSGTFNELEEKVNKKSSSHNRKGSLLSMAKNYIKKHIEIEEEEDTDDYVKPSMKEKLSETSITLQAISHDLKTSSKEQSVPKSESGFSKKLKSIFKKRSSLASNNNVEIPAVELTDGQSEDVKTLRDESISLMMVTAEVDSESRKNKPKEFAIPKSSFADEKRIKKLEDEKSWEALKKQVSAGSDDRSSIKCVSKKGDKQKESSPASIDPKTQSAENSFVEFETRRIQDENREAKRSESKTESKDVGLNRPFASMRKSTIVMMAAADAPRTEPQTENSDSSNRTQTGSSSSPPTAFYYLLGPSLDEALVDVRVVFQNLIDKITGKNR